MENVKNGLDKRYFVFLFNVGYVFLETENDEYPIIQEVVRQTKGKDKILYYIFEFKNKKDYLAAQGK